MTNNNRSPIVYSTINQTAFSLRNSGLINQSTSSLPPQQQQQQQQQKFDVDQQFPSSADNNLAQMDFSFSVDFGSWSPSSAQSSPGGSSSSSVASTSQMVGAPQAVVGRKSKDVTKKVVSPKKLQQQQKKQKKQLAGAGAGAGVGVGTATASSASAFSASDALTPGMNMVLTLTSDCVVEKGITGPWGLQLSGHFVRADDSITKRQHIVVIASVHSEDNETYNLENYTGNCLDDGTVCLKGIRVTKTKDSDSTGTFKLRFIAYDKFIHPNGELVPIPNCNVESNFITYLSGTKCMSPATILNVERVAADQLPSGFITDDSITYKLTGDRFKSGKSYNSMFGYQHPKTFEIVYYVTETVKTRLAFSLNKKVSCFLSVPNEYKDFNLVTGFYHNEKRAKNVQGLYTKEDKKNIAFVWSTSSFQIQK
ncbi:hypothetical protein DFA_04971 [Cavenderia fasciculata]|uniref:Uncharacterized protein n=1 Tax=Cavenderia fasciculata TaxID=261658 RepID=F4PMP4_CACFS|nr:uncharacterized protein DFA_04971 [Cavenderia fasciculata]EGG22841.1 hypothetical protein DFA_04971 [Cavenderia fasciculata]|eukprot:XP_004360692.1 hypothetical protein DFA_04971 [Cavenderia fasciculata]